MDVCQGYKMINAYLYSVKEEDCASDKWDYGLIKEMFNRNNIKPIRTTFLPKVERAFVVIPGPQNVDFEETISNELNNIGRVVLFITGDESATFNVDKIKHNNIEIWIQYPHQKHEKYNKLPVGVPQHLSKNLPEYQDKVYDIFFAGQITHQRRQELSKIMPTIQNSFYKATEGFAQGLKPKAYYDKMFLSKIVPCPSGAEVIDSFRFYEAIEMLCLPIGDKIDSKGNETNFYNFVFKTDFPIEITDNWKNIKKIIPSSLNNYPHNMHQVVSWWIKYKRDLSIKLMDQVNE
jgi:hypothetical protein